MLFYWVNFICLVGTYPTSFAVVFRDIANVILNEMNKIRYFLAYVAITPFPFGVDENFEEYQVIYIFQSYTPIEEQQPFSPFANRGIYGNMVI